MECLLEWCIETECRSYQLELKTEENAQWG